MELDLKYIDFPPTHFLYLGERNSKGQPHGKGIEIDNNKNLYKGSFKNGKRHGWFIEKHRLKNSNLILFWKGYAINGEMFYHFKDYEKRTT